MWMVLGYFLGGEGGKINVLMTESRFGRRSGRFSKTNWVAGSQLLSKVNKHFKREEIMQNYQVSIGWPPTQPGNHVGW